MSYRCDICGQFKKLDDLRTFFTPDTHFTSEEIWHKCRECMSYEELEQHEKTLKKLEGWDRLESQVLPYPEEEE